MVSVPAASFSMRRFGRNETGMVGTCALSASLIFTGVAGSVSNDGIRAWLPVVYVLLRVLAGAGAALIEVSAYATAVDVFPEDLGKISGLNEVITGVGFMAGPSLGSWMYVVLGIRNAFLVFSSLMMATIPITIALNRCQAIDRRDNLAAKQDQDPETTNRNVASTSGDVPEKNSKKMESTWRRYMKLLRNSRFRVCTGQAFLTTLGTFMLYAQLPTYLNLDQGLSQVETGLLLSVDPLTYLIAGFPLGWLADLWNPFRMSSLGILYTGVINILFAAAPIYQWISKHSRFTIGTVNIARDIVFLLFYGVFEAAAQIPVLASMTQALPPEDLDDPIVSEDIVGIYAIFDCLAAGVGPLIAPVVVIYTGFEGLVLLLGAMHMAYGFFCMHHETERSIQVRSPSNKLQSGSDNRPPALPQSNKDKSLGCEQDTTLEVGKKDRARMASTAVDQQVFDRI